MSSGRDRGGDRRPAGDGAHQPGALQRLLQPGRHPHPACTDSRRRWRPLARAGVLRARRARRGLHRRHPLQPGGRPLRARPQPPRRSGTSGRSSRSCRITRRAQGARRSPGPPGKSGYRDTRNGTMAPSPREAVLGPLLRGRPQPPRAAGDPAGLPAGRGRRARHAAGHRGPGPAPPRPHVGPLPPAPGGGAVRRGRRNGARADLALDPGQPLELPRVRGAGPAGEIVARATTAWVVLDLVRRRPVRLADMLPDYPLEPRRAIADDFLPLPRPAARRARAAIHGAAERPGHEPPRQQRRLRRVGAGIGAGEVAETGRPVDIEVGYRAEALAGDTVLARCAPEAGAGAGPVPARDRPGAGRRGTGAAARQVGLSGPSPGSSSSSCLLLLFLLPALAHQAGAAPADRDGHEEEQGDQQPEGGLARHGGHPGVAAVRPSAATAPRPRRFPSRRRRGTRPRSRAPAARASGRRSAPPDWASRNARKLALWA